MSARTLAMMAVLGAPAVPGCDAAGPAEPSSPAVTRAASVEPAPPARRGRLIAGERVERIPQWPAAGSIDATAQARLPGPAQAALSRSPVPVLVPGEGPLLANSAIYSQSTGYALSASHAGQNVAIQASKVATLLPHVGHVPGNTPIRGVRGWVSSNEGVRTASWIEHGVAYSLDLECQAPDGPDCSEAALRAAVEGLVYVGGAGALQPRGGSR